MKNYLETGTVWILKTPDPSGDETRVIDYVAPSGDIYYTVDGEWEEMPMNWWKQEIEAGLLRPQDTWPNFERVR